MVSRVVQKEMGKEARRMAKQAKLVAAKEAKQQQRARRDLAVDAANYIGGANAQYSSTKRSAKIAGNRDT